MSRDLKDNPFTQLFDSLEEAEYFASEIAPRLIPELLAQSNNIDDIMEDDTVVVAENEVLNNTIEEVFGITLNKRSSKSVVYLSELVCVDSHGRKGKLGVLPSDGFMFTCSLNLIRKVLHPQFPLLEALHKSLQLRFEIAIGMNGFIWLKCRSTKETIAIANMILASEFKNINEIKTYCNDIGYALAGFTT